MMPFSTGIGLERVGVVGPDLDRWRAGLLDAGSSALKYDRSNGDPQALGMALLCKNKNGGRRELCPWPLRCLSQFLSERKERLLKLLRIGVSMCLRMSLRTFHR